jgi:hypothetical protein
LCTLFDEQASIRIGILQCLLKRLSGIDLNTSHLSDAKSRNAISQMTSSAIRISLSSLCSFQNKAFAALSATIFSLSSRVSDTAKSSLSKRTRSGNIYGLSLMQLGKVPKGDSHNDRYGTGHGWIRRHRPRASADLHKRTLGPPQATSEDEKSFFDV